MHTSLYDLAPAAPPSATLDAMPPREPSSCRRSYVPLLILLLITAFGAAIRFYRLGFPALWNDESLVYWRVCGTYAQMLKPLSKDGFPPLHYSLYWLIGHYFKLTPQVMRFIPALAGTLMIPAMYALARQMLPRSTALLAAAFTACSAFMLFYSRDTKMYPDAWLFVTLNLACLLWWFRTKKSTAWLCWIATGCAMVGIHASALAILAVSPILLLTQRQLHWKHAVLFVIGMIVIVSGPVGYFTKFNHWTENVEDRGWRASGIGWVGGFNGDRTGPQHVQYTTTAFLIGWEWPRDDYLTSTREPIAEPLLRAPMAAATEVLFLLSLGLLPWPLFLRPRRDADPALEPQWRVFFWLACLTVLPAYTFYCRSVQDFVSPRAWLTELSTALSPRWWAFAAICLAGFMVTAAIIPRFRPVLLRFIKFTLAVVAVFGLCLAIFSICHPMSLDAMLSDQPWRSIWTPRYLGFVWPAFGIIVAALLMRLPTRVLRIAAIVFVLGVNLAMASLRLALNTEAPIPQVAADVWASQPRDATVRAYTHFDRQDGSPGGTSLYRTSGEYYLQMLADFYPMSPDLFEHSLSRYRLWRSVNPRLIAQDVKNNPQLTHLIVWDQFDPDVMAITDPLAPILPGWKLQNEQWFTIRVYWDWRQRWKYLRREYVRMPGK